MILARFADRAVDGAIKLAPFLAEHGDYQDKDIRRLQARWRADKGRLLENARLRRDAREPETIIDLLMSLHLLIDRTVGASSPAMQKLADSLDKAEARIEARRSLQIPQVGEIALAAAEHKAAVEAFETRMEGGDEVLAAEFGHLTTKQLRLSHKLHAWAFTLHQLALQAAERERAEPENSSSAKPEDGRPKP